MMNALRTPSEVYFLLAVKMHFSDYRDRLKCLLRSEVTIMNL